jgi:trehalose 6-phosphate synthase
MHVALTMPAPERKERHSALVEKVFRTTAHAYCQRFIEALSQVKASSVPRAAA